MEFNSMQYILFFVLVGAVNYILPKRVRYIWLLGASLYFYANWNAVYTFLIVGVILVSFVAALGVEHFKKQENDKAAKWCLVGALVACFGLLAYFKYTNFLIQNLNALIRLVQGVERNLLDIVLPVGISFFVFQALGYVIDVYRGTVEAEKNPLRFALFVAFFPQLVAGPIERSKNLMHQLAEPNPVDADRLREGLIYILFGMWQKVYVADRLSGYINPVFNDFANRSTVDIGLATVFFAFQIYCDFGGYSNIAIGSAKILGVDLMRNFNSPYMAVNISDFWKRWHISLTKWFTDYVYIPLGGNRRGAARTYVNTLIVFFLSGLWHGASWHFVFWGVLNGALLCVCNAWHKKHEVSDNKILTWVRRLATFVVADFTWFFFRVNSMGDVGRIARHCMGGLGTVGMFAQWQEVAIVISGLVILIVTDVIREQTDCNLAGEFLKLNVVLRWVIYLAFAFLILVFGAYGEDYEQTAFIYFQF